MAQKQKKGKKAPARSAKKKAPKRKPVIVPEIVAEGKEYDMATQLLELGSGGGLGIVARTPEECVAKGGIVKRPPPWSKLPFVCAKPPPWARARREMAVPGLRGWDGASVAGGFGAFVSEEQPCAPGYVKVETVHPFWKRGRFFMCVRPGTVPRIPAGPPRYRPPGLREVRIPRMSGVGAVTLLPAEISIPMIMLGDALGITVATIVPRIVESVIKPVEKKPLGSRIAKIGLGGAGVITYFAAKSSFTLGLAFGTLPGAVEAIAGLVADAIAKPAPAAVPFGPPTPTLVGGRRLGQLTPADIRELEEIAERLAGPRARVGDAEYESEEVPESPIVEISI